VTYCLNPHCHKRDNPPSLEYCHACGSPLLIAGRYQHLQPIHLRSPVRTTEVFIAQQLDGKRKVLKALQSQNPAQAERFEREAFILQIQNHPGIPHSYFDDYFEFTPAHSDTLLHCLVMDFVEGQTLEDWVEQNGRASQDQILDWLAQLADILKTLHELQFIHCDIKPSNIILRPDGHLALIDFGLAASMGEDRREVIAGTAGYVAPEQVEGTPLPQSDFYALGRTMIRLGTGVSLGIPTKDPKTGQLLWQKLAPQLDPPVVDLLDRLSAPGIALRPPSAQAILGELETLPDQIKRWKRQKLLCSWPAKAVYALLLLALLGFGGTRYIGDVAYRWGLQDQGVGLFEDSLPKFRFSVWLNPRAEVYDSLGLSCQQLGDNICAVRAFSDSLALNETLWSAHYHLGSLYEDQLGMDEDSWVDNFQQGTLDDQPLYDLAEDHYRQAVQYGPRNMALAISNLARLKNLTGEYSQAAELAQQGLKQTNNPFQQAGLYKNLGWAEFGMKNYKAARPYLEQSIALANDRADAFCLLAQVDTALEKPTQAKSSWQSCLLLNSENPEVRYWRNQVLDGLL
jgi:serine/threonine protein kinase